MKKLQPWHCQQLWHPRPLVGSRGRPGTKLLPFSGRVSNHTYRGLTVETAAPQGSQSDTHKPLLDGSGTKDARTMRHRSLSLPTVSPPSELQDALKRLFSREETSMPSGAIVYTVKGIRTYRTFTVDLSLALFRIPGSTLLTKSWGVDPENEAVHRFPP